MFLIIPFLIFFTSASVKIYKKTKMHIGVGFIIFFFLYSLLTHWTGIVHVSGIYNQIIFWFLVVCMSTVGIMAIIMEKMIKELLIFLATVIILFLFLVFISPKINHNQDYSTYIPMVNSISGNIYEGQNNSLYTNLTIYHFMGNFFLLDALKLNFSMVITFPILVASVLALFFPKNILAKFACMALMFTIFIIGFENQMIGYGSVFWCSFFIIVALFLSVKRQNIFATLSLSLAILSAGASAIFVIFIPFIIIVSTLLFNEKITFKEVFCLLCVSLFAFFTSLFTRVNPKAIIFIVSWLLFASIIITLYVSDMQSQFRVKNISKLIKKDYIKKIIKYCLGLATIILLVIGNIYMRGIAYTESFTWINLWGGSISMEEKAIYFGVAILFVSLLISELEIITINFLVMLATIILYLIIMKVNIFPSYVVARGMRVTIGIYSSSIPILIFCGFEKNTYEKISGFVSTFIMLPITIYYSYDAGWLKAEGILQAKDWWGMNMDEINAYKSEVFTKWRKL